MKKGVFSMLVLLVIITASCSVTAGIPWLYGGWGFFADFGFNCLSSNSRDVDVNGHLELKQDGKDLVGTLEVDEAVYNVKGSYLKDGTVVLKLFDEEKFLYELKGAVEGNKLVGKSWHAEKEL
ncbi:MAG: hypothetical protein U9N62_01060 [Thermotogota bacterium]|nr:hypothetical protein [Thermotogota bacterium]